MSNKKVPAAEKILTIVEEVNKLKLKLERIETENERLLSNTKHFQLNVVLSQIAMERARQDQLFGDQDRGDKKWFSILMSCVDKAEGILDSGMNAMEESIVDPFESDRLYTEVIQVAAVAVVWLENMNRREIKIKRTGNENESCT